ncbi:MAG: 30S ribosomal protein S6 [Patescibacteria group bacterium]
MKQHYEMLLLRSGKLSEQDLAATFRKVVSVISADGGAVTIQEHWGSRKLAYDIRHERTGFYDLLEFDLESAGLKKFDAALRLMPEVLRFLIIKKRVKTAEEIARQKRIQERIAERRVTVERERVAAQTAERTVATPPPAAVPAKPKLKEKEKISLDDLDKKLDDLLQAEL